MKNKKPPYNINELADKWLKGIITPEEKSYYEEWYSSFNDSETHFKSEILQSSRELEDKIYVDLNNRILHKGEQKQQKVYPIRWLAIAASILLCLSFGGYFLLHQQATEKYAQNKVQEIVPGSNKAILHLGNGHHISLPDAASGELTKQGGSSITKTTDGGVVYTAANRKEAAMVYDTLIIPRAGTYHLILADGSKVWLNAATAVRYPESFNGKERAVELLYGEAYFEVVHNANRPFKVFSANQVIEDIGTHFNVKAYNDEKNQQTTLLEGSVKVSVGDKSAILKPGQQSQSPLGNVNPIVQVLNDVDIEEAVAWKNGYFRFNDSKIENVMRQLSRWYNINVSYAGVISGEGFNGKISRYKNISQVLKMLEKTKAVHFKVEGRRVTVMQ